VAVKRRGVAVASGRSIDGFVWICLHLSCGRIKAHKVASARLLRATSVPSPVYEHERWEPSILWLIAMIAFPLTRVIDRWLYASL
jgi:hypothetical protein